MNIHIHNKRGTFVRYNGRDDTAVETVCDCKCHTRGGMHMVACCISPKTADGKALLEAYEVTQYALQSNDK